MTRKLMYGERGDKPDPIVLSYPGVAATTLFPRGRKSEWLGDQTARRLHGLGTVVVRRSGKSVGLVR